MKDLLETLGALAIALTYVWFLGTEPAREAIDRAHEKIERSAKELLE